MVARVVKGTDLVEVVAGEQQLVRQLRVTPDGAIVFLAHIRTGTIRIRFNHLL
jgi:hypothetical protein